VGGDSLKIGLVGTMEDSGLRNPEIHEKTDVVRDAESMDTFLPFAVTLEVPTFGMGWDKLATLRAEKINNQQLAGGSSADNDYTKFPHIGNLIRNANVDFTREMFSDDPQFIARLSYILGDVLPKDPWHSYRDSGESATLRETLVAFGYNPREGSGELKDITIGELLKSLPKATSEKDFEVVIGCCLAARRPDLAMQLIPHVYDLRNADQQFLCKREVATRMYSDDFHGHTIDEERVGRISKDLTREDLNSKMSENVMFGWSEFFKKTARNYRQYGTPEESSQFLDSLLEFSQNLPKDFGLAANRTFLEVVDSFAVQKAILLASVGEGTSNDAKHEIIGLLDRVRTSGMDQSRLLGDYNSLYAALMRPKKVTWENDLQLLRSAISQSVIADTADKDTIRKLITHFEGGEGVASIGDADTFKTDTQPQGQVGYESPISAEGKTLQDVLQDVPVEFHAHLLQMNELISNIGRLHGVKPELANVRKYLIEVDDRVNLKKLEAISNIGLSGLLLNMVKDRGMQLAIAKDAGMGLITFIAPALKSGKIGNFAQSIVRMKAAVDVMAGSSVNTNLVELLKKSPEAALTAAISLVVPSIQAEFNKPAYVSIIKELLRHLGSDVGPDALTSLIIAKLPRGTDIAQAVQTFVNGAGAEGVDLIKQQIANLLLTLKKQA